MKSRILFLAFSFASSFCVYGADTRVDVADLVIFSYDRPLQLYALLESIEKQVKGVGQTTVIYRASDVGYKGAYGMVAQKFSHAKFLEQGAKPQEDFKPLTLRATFDSPSNYVIFAVDDIVVKDSVDLSECIAVLERTKAYGFYLRLGDHLNFCYTMNKEQRVPELKNIDKDVYSWVFAHSECDWAYPHTVDMTVFRKKDIESSFKKLEYHSPNSLEAQWASSAGSIMNQQGLCFKESKIVNLPFNRVQKEISNKSMEISTHLLLTRFLQGYKLALEPLYQIKNLSAHMEYEPTFILRAVPKDLKNKSVTPEPLKISDELLAQELKKTQENGRKEQQRKKEPTVKEAPAQDPVKNKDEVLKRLALKNVDALVGKKLKKDGAWYKKIAQLDEKRMVIVTPSYKNAEWYKRNLDSVFNQRYCNWYMIYVDDCSPDGTGELVKAYAKERGYEDQVIVVCNQVRRKAMANLYTAIYMCAPTDIVVILDGDDWLAFDDVLNEVNFMYSTYDVWLTYGQYKEYPSGNIGFCRDYPREIVEYNAFRSYSHGPSHLRTFYAGLFHKIKIEDLIMDGEFFPMTYDLAMMFPMIEMARDHFMFCSTPLLEYNTSNPINDHKVSQELQRKCDKIIRSRGRYEKIESLFDAKN